MKNNGLNVRSQAFGRAHPVFGRGAHLLGSIVAASLLAPAMPAGASTTEHIELAPVAPSTRALPTVLVRATAVETQGYAARRGSTATKTDTPLAETPQSVTVITSDQIRDTGAGNLQDALLYAAGVRSDAYGLDSRTDSARVRGASPDEYLDGLRESFNYYTSQWRNEVYGLERVEVLRGPSAMLYGQGTTGGVINMVSKRPQSEARREIGVRAGSHGLQQIELDLTGPLAGDGALLYRLVAVGRDAGTQVDEVGDDRIYVAPSLTWLPTDATAVTVSGAWQQDRTGSTSQFFPWAGVVTPNPNGPLPTARFIGDPEWDRYDTDHRHLGWQVEHRFGDAWSVHHNLRYTDNDVDYRSLYGDSFVLPGGWAADPVGQRLFGRFAYASRTRVRMLSADQYLAGRLVIGPVEHRFIAGIDVARFRQTGASGFDSPDYLGGGVPSVDAYDPVYPPFDGVEMFAAAKSRIRHTGFYLQNQMKLDQHWIAVAGIRRDRTRNRTAGSDLERTGATSKRAGLMYAFASGWTPYVSYSESFKPQANRAGQSFKPLRGEQWELGVKATLLSGRLSLATALYDLKERNQIVEVLPNVFEQLESTRVQGVEFEARGNLTAALELIAHYNFTDADEQLEELPRHQAALWAKWRLPLAAVEGISIGAGVRHMSSFADGLAPTTPAHTLLDALVTWEHRDWRVALNASNLTDKKYVATCLERGDCWFGARRNVVVSVTRSW